MRLDLHKSKVIHLNLGPHTSYKHIYHYIIYIYIYMQHSTQNFLVLLHRVMVRIRVT